MLTVAATAAPVSVAEVPLQLLLEQWYVFNLHRNILNIVFIDRTGAGSLIHIIAPSSTYQAPNVSN